MERSLGFAFSGFNFTLPPPAPPIPEEAFVFKVVVEAIADNSLSLLIGFSGEQSTGMEINWGDGSVSTGVISLNSREPSILGSAVHSCELRKTYSQDNEYTVIITCPVEPILFKFNGDTHRLVSFTNLPEFYTVYINGLSADFDLSLFENTVKRLTVLNADHEIVNVTAEYDSFTLQQSAIETFAIVNDYHTSLNIRQNKNLSQVEITTNSNYDQNSISFNPSLSSVTLTNPVATSLSFLEWDLQNLYIEAGLNLDLLIMTGAQFLESIELVDCPVLDKLLISNCRLLTDISLSNTALGSINASNCTAIITVDLTATEITEVDFRQCNSFTGLTSENTVFIPTDTVTYLDLSGCNLEAGTMNEILAILTANSTVTYCNLSDQLTGHTPSLGAIAAFEAAHPTAQLIY